MNWLALIGIPICGILWAMGGDEKYPLWLRRIGVPITVALMGLVFTFLHPLIWLAILSAACLYGASTIGYGIPDDPEQKVPPPDEGSPLGAFFFKMFYDPDHGRTYQYAAKMANLLTRFTVGILYGASVGILAFLNHWWMIFASIFATGFVTMYVNAIMDDPGPILGLNGREVLTGTGIGLLTIVSML